MRLRKSGRYRRSEVERLPTTPIILCIVVSVSRSYVTRLFEVDTDFKNVFTLKKGIKIWPIKHQIVGRKSNIKILLTPLSLTVLNTTKSWRVTVLSLCKDVSLSCTLWLTKNSSSNSESLAYSNGLFTSVQPKSPIEFGQLGSCSCKSHRMRIYRMGGTRVSPRKFTKNVPVCRPTRAS